MHMQWINTQNQTSQGEVLWYSFLITGDELLGICIRTSKHFEADHHKSSAYNNLQNSKAISDHRFYNFF